MLHYVHLAYSRYALSVPRKEAVGIREVVNEGDASASLANVSGKGADPFLEACLLQTLRQGAGHGYALMEPLVQFGIAQDDLNASTLYRTLRAMERKGWLTSGWESGGPGPRRRVYLLTQKGLQELDRRIGLMRARLTGIQRLVAEYAAFEPDDSTEHA